MQTNLNRSSSTKKVPALNHGTDLQRKQSSSNLKTGPKTKRQFPPLPKFDDFSKEEKEVLEASSHLNGQTFPIWNPSLHQIGPAPPDSKLFEDSVPVRYNSKQVNYGAVLARPSDVFECKPTDVSIFGAFSWRNARQSVVDDCSVIASLLLLGYAEERLKLAFLTSNVYPQLPDVGCVPNPSGRYYVRFYFNGAWRMVEIDDRLPRHPSSYVRPEKTKRLLCGHIAGKKEIWLSLYEKAYLKLRGESYGTGDIQSGETIHFMASWIPDIWRLYPSEGDNDTENMSEEDKKKEQQMESFWEQLKEGYATATTLATVGSDPDMLDGVVESTGLIRDHCYAVLDAKEVDGHRMVKLRNPFMERGWKGKFSLEDSGSWSDAMKQRLHFDPEEVKKRPDNGVFFLCFEDLRRYFTTMTVSWSPLLFPYQRMSHCLFAAHHQFDEELQRTYYSPQFLVRKQRGQRYWFLLQRHWEDLEEEELDEPIDPLIALRFHVHTVSVTGPDGMLQKRTRPISSVPTVCRVANVENRVDPTIYSTWMYALEKIEDDFEGYYTMVVSLMKAPKRKRDLRFTVSCYSNRPVAVSRIPIIQKNQCKLRTKTRPYPLIRPLTPREGVDVVKRTSINLKELTSSASSSSSPSSSSSSSSSSPTTPLSPPSTAGAAMQRASAAPDTLFPIVCDKPGDGSFLASLTDQSPYLPYIRIAQVMFAPQFNLTLTPNEGSTSSDQASSSSSSSSSSSPSSSSNLPGDVSIVVDSQSNTQFYIDAEELKAAPCPFLPSSSPFNMSMTERRYAPSSLHFLFSKAAAQMIFSFESSQASSPSSASSSSSSSSSSSTPSDKESPRYLRIATPSPLNDLESNDEFTLTVVPPPGYTAKVEQILSPWLYAAYQLSWFGVAGKIDGQKQNPMQIKRRYFILEAEGNTEVYIQFLFKTSELLLYNPYFKVFELGAVEKESGEGADDEDKAKDGFCSVAKKLMKRLTLKNGTTAKDKPLFESTEHSNRNYAHRFPSTLDSNFGTPDECYHAGFSAGSGLLKGKITRSAEERKKESAKEKEERRTKGRYLIELGVAFLDHVDFLAFIWTIQAPVVLYSLE
ncbi:putative CRE-CLP-2 protein [Monocercomonoides exilis]|uniref:putative CRE-CLP-2 protein n=1 Tax=Monocercomonoides exilis TaxID=2049356 RepID=UPI003559A487|nr:putative CRE-CLP-2 protein [Monocercomonoides exilis]|eukprot:MONOS_11737.1-p1 / transcript=MONOS_11737.1 / gene=MONOS_11737 / organism=Monocercomonoides_exilis_PA203 / gene_product=CRE-CLP-2 protein / transcript_product=CRE-CLP-2 protein / location=Mono_scaffold00606:25699-28956(+) / protein_length=1085 / sequence_SO=supercontig / SO=protein_coding / is_pseudo=false